MKKPRKLFKIGEVMEYAEISRQTLHNYTVQGLISEEDRTASGHRLYSEQVFDRLEKILDLKKKGYTLSQIQGLLKNG